MAKKVSKDPAFLLYSKDWLQGTAELMPEEKGVYIDLLCNQHQSLDLPSDTKRLARIVGMSEEAFLPIWAVLKCKFVHRSVDRLVNEKLTEIMGERSTKGHTNRITGRFAVLIRSVNHLPKSKIQFIKDGFDIDDYLPFSTEQATERLTEWFYVRLKSIEDGNANANEDENKKGGAGENKTGTEAGSHDPPEFWETAKTSFLTDEQWEYQFTTGKDISREKFGELTKEFISDLELQNDFKDLKELRKHFVHWFNKKNEKNGRRKEHAAGAKNGAAKEPVYGRP